MATNRSGANQTCWSLVPSIPLQPSSNVDVPVRRILSGAAPAAPSSPISDASICGKVDLNDIDVHFLYFEPGNVMTPAVVKSVRVSADTVGPAPPAVVEARPGDTRAEVVFENAAGASGVSSIAGVKVFCERATTNAAGGDAGNVCEGKELAPGATPDLATTERLGCGSLAGSTGTSIAADHLPNDVPHVLAIAGVDSFGNVGPLSSLACTTPTAAADDGGGEGCSMARPRASSAPATLGALLAALIGAGLLGRRRSNAHTMARRTM